MGGGRYRAHLKPRWDRAGGAVTAFLAYRAAAESFWGASALRRCVSAAMLGCHSRTSEQFIDYCNVEVVLFPPRLASQEIKPAGSGQCSLEGGSFEQDLCCRTVGQELFWGQSLAQAVLGAMPWLHLRRNLLARSGRGAEANRKG